MAWIDRAYVDSILEASVTSAIFGESGSFNQTVFDNIVAIAQNDILSGMLNSGYADPGATTTNVTLKGAVVGRACLYAYGRPNIGLPPTAAIEALAAKAQAIIEGTLKIPGLDPSQISAVGGMEFSDSDADTSGSRSQVFGRDDLTSM